MDKIRVGVIGTNFITDWMIAGARLDPRFELTAVCSRTEETAAAFAARHGIPYRYTSVEELAASPHVDAVYVASPNFRHADQSITCMSRGKHVLCEKPLAANAAEARAMIEASACYGVVLMEAMKPTLTPGFRAVIDNLGRVGRVRRYFASFCQYSSRYDSLKEGALPNAFNPAMANGAIMDIGVYTIYPMIALFGKPTSVMASADMLPTGADGQGTVVSGYDGFDGVAMYSKIADSQLPSEIEGEDGIITIDRINQIGKVWFTPHVANKSGGAARDFRKELLFEPSVDVDNDYFYEMKEFIDIIRSGRRESSVNTHARSFETMEVIDEIRSQIGLRFPSDSMAD